MSSPFKKGASILRRANFMGNVMDRAGVSNSNFFRQVLDPGGQTIRRVEQEGFQGVINQTREGNITDPLNAFHTTRDTSSPEAPPPAPDGLAQGTLARQRIRRQVYRAQGRSSTIRSQSGGLFNSGNQLLGS